MSRAALAFLILAAAAALAAPTASAQPVPSLQPKATGQLWHQLVRHPRHVAAVADCRPLRAVFYTDTDWLRLATKLAANPSPCAQYYVSVPPLSADKTSFRHDQGWRIDALGPQFHAIAEINYTAWSRWVAAGNGTWYDAGLQARRNMARDNFDVNRGDIWAVNEATSAVRAGTGAARQNLRDLVRGLYTGDGGQPVRGVVFTIGPAQVGTNVAVYQSNLEGWLQDSAFWTDMNTYVSDFSQEVYGDVRASSVPAAPAQQRRDHLVDWLGHVLLLADAAPDPAGTTARTYLQQAFTPLANAAWPWQSSFGFTDVPVDLMAQYVSTQTYALRALDANAGLPQDHFGFAWAPRGSATDTATLLDRMAAAINDSGATVDPEDPGVGACGPPGQNLACGGDLPGAAFTDAWSALRTWVQAASTFTGLPPTLVAGAPSGPLTVQLVTGTAANVTPGETTVTLSSTSPSGAFSSAPTGPWAPTLSLTIPAGAGATPQFWYRDTAAGGPTLRAVVAGRADGIATVRVQAGQVRTLTVTPRRVVLHRGGRRVFVASASDGFGNRLSAVVTWTVRSRALGRVSAHRGVATTFTASARARGRTVLVAVAATPVGRVSIRVPVSVR